MMFFLRRRKFKISTVVALAAALTLMATELLAGSHSVDNDESVAATPINASNETFQVKGSVIIPH